MYGSVGGDLPICKVNLLIFWLLVLIFLFIFFKVSKYLERPEINWISRIESIFDFENLGITSTLTHHLEALVSRTSATTSTVDLHAAIWDSLRVGLEIGGKLLASYFLTSGSSPPKPSCLRICHYSHWWIFGRCISCHRVNQMWSA